LQGVITASSGKRISRDLVESVTGAPRATMVNSFIEALLSKDSEKALAAVSEAENGGVSMSVFLSLILEKMRFILLLEHSGNNSSVLNNLKSRVSEDDLAFIAKQSEKKALTPSMLVSLLDAASATPRAQIDQLPLELAVVEICR